MKILYTKYNKVTNESFAILNETLEGLYLDLIAFGDDINLLPYETINAILNTHDFDVIMVGDIFWPTGQNICKWCKENSKKCCFLQHGQWIYVVNKKNPSHVPDYTCLFGSNMQDMMQTWEYAKRSRLEVTGTPRYDDIVPMATEDFVYFAPPVISEVIEGFGDKWNEVTYQAILNLKGLDDEVQLAIHPHYREGRCDILREIFPLARFIKVKDNPLFHIPKCKGVLTHRNSTSVLDAIACHKYTVLMTRPSFYEKGYFGPFAYEALNLKEVVSGLGKEFQVYNYNEKAFPHIRLGDASKRIMEVIK